MEPRPRIAEEVRGARAHRVNDEDMTGKPQHASAPGGLSVPVLVAAFVLMSVLLANLRLQWPPGVFIESWAGGRLNVAGFNPYDSAAMLLEQREVGLHEPRPVMMYNPPWALALAMPL